MANPEHLRIFRQGVTAWNQWRRKHHSVQPDLSDADLREASLRSANLNNAILRNANLEGANLGRAWLEGAVLRGAMPRGAHLFGADLGKTDLREADLQDAQLWHARLEESDLAGANLFRADLRYSDLSRANLSRGDLRSANLASTKLLWTDLREANLRGANLQCAHLQNNRLEGADLAEATMALTAVNDVDLSRVRGLQAVCHDQASSIGIDTLERTAVGLARDPARQAEVEAFLRGVGVREDYLDLFRSGIAKPFDVYSVFIRYSHADQRVARRLYHELQTRGIRCWLNEHPMLPGDDINECIDQGLRPRDKLLLCCSEASLTSWWVDDEIDRAFTREHQLMTQGEAKAPGLVPLNLDGYLASGEWKSRRSEQIRSRLVADFKGWEEADATFDRELERVVKALRAGAC